MDYVSKPKETKEHFTGLSETTKVKRQKEPCLSGVIPELQDKLLQLNIRGEPFYHTSDIVQAQKDSSGAKNKF